MRVPCAWILTVCPLATTQLSSRGKDLRRDHCRHGCPRSAIERSKTDPDGLELAYILGPSEKNPSRSNQPVSLLNASNDSGGISHVGRSKATCHFVAAKHLLYRRHAATPGTYDKIPPPLIGSSSFFGARSIALTTRSTRTPTGGAARLRGRRLPWFVRPRQPTVVPAPKEKMSLNHHEVHPSRTNSTVCSRIGASRSTLYFGKRPC